MYEVRAILEFPLPIPLIYFHQAFNEELDGMYNDANLPDDEAWVAMAQDLRETKESRNNLTKENSCVFFVFFFFFLQYFCPENFTCIGS